MLQPATTVAVQLIFVDRGGNQAQLQYRLIASLSMSQIDAIASLIEANIRALSTAVIIRRLIVLKVKETDPAIPSPQSDVTRSIDLLYINQLTAFSVSIPSPPDNIWASDTYGSNTILDKRNPAIYAQFQAFTDALAVTVDNDGNVIVPLLLNGVNTL